MTTKIHTICDALGNPIDFHLTVGNAHDLDGADHFLSKICMNKIQSLIADKAYHAKERVLDILDQSNVEVVIPSKSNHKQPRSYDKELYKSRHLIENFFAKLKQYRAIATRYDKRASCFLGAIYLAAAVIWLN